MKLIYRPLIYFLLTILLTSTFGEAYAQDDCISSSAKPIYTLDAKETGATGDGATDDTSAIQKAIDSIFLKGGGEVAISDGIYMIDARRGIYLKDRVVLKMTEGAILKAIPNDKEGFSILKIHRASNVKVIGGILMGERYEHLGKSGEWGMGLHISESNNVIIKNLTSSNNWGDGFYINGNSSNITFCSVVADRNRRQGMSITSGKNIKVMNSTFKNTKGTRPEAGLDIEPNRGDTVYNVQISNSDFSNNAGHGILSYVAPDSEMTSASQAIIGNNTITKNGRGGVVIVNSLNFKVINNIFIENHDNAILFDKLSRGGVAENNTIYLDIKDRHTIENRGGNIIRDNILRRKKP